MPENYPLLGHLKLDRPIYDDKIPKDDLLKSLPVPDWHEFEKFGPTVWGPQAFTKSFEKFDYAPPSNFFEQYPDFVNLLIGHSTNNMGSLMILV